MALLCLLPPCSPPELLSISVEKLSKETEKYMEGDLSDLAEGLKDDINNVKGQVSTAREAGRKGGEGGRAGTNWREESSEATKGRKRRGIKLGGKRTGREQKRSEGGRERRGWKGRRGGGHWISTVNDRVCTGGWERRRER